LKDGRFHAGTVLTGWYQVLGPIGHGSMGPAAAHERDALHRDLKPAADLVHAQ
jgi:hypothetical protein